MAAANEVSSTLSTMMISAGHVALTSPVAIKGPYVATFQLAKY